MNHKYNMLLYEFRSVSTQLADFEHSENMQCLKGFIVCKRRGTHTYYYLRRVDYVDKKPVCRDKYIKQQDLPGVRERLAGKKKNRSKYNWLKRLRDRLLQRLKRLSGAGFGLFARLEAHRHRKDEKDRNTNHKGCVRQNIVTMLGEKVRSKGECIVANAAYALGIPYYYEKAVTVASDFEKFKKTFFHPDFTLVIDGKEFYIELLGMYEKEDYRENWEYKKQKYELAGIVCGKNLVCFSCEDSKNVNSHTITETFLALLKGIVPAKTVEI